MILSVDRCEFPVIIQLTRAEAEVLARAVGSYKASKFSIALFRELSEALDTIEEDTLNAD